MPTVGENGYHRVKAESLDDSIQGDDITIQYLQRGDNTTIDGATVVGVDENDWDTIDRWSFMIDQE